MASHSNRQAVKCTAHCTDGRKCRAWAVNGTHVCSVHGGRIPAVKAHAAEVVAERKAMRTLDRLDDFDPVTDPVERLQLLAGRAERFMTIMGDLVSKLTAVRYRTDSEQLRSEVAVYERAMASTGRLLVDLAKLGLDERAVRVQEIQVAIVGDALRQALLEAQVPEPERQAIVVRVAELVMATGPGQAALPAPAARRPAA